MARSSPQAKAAPGAAQQEQDRDARPLRPVVVPGEPPGWPRERRSGCGTPPARLLLGSAPTWCCPSEALPHQDESLEQVDIACEVSARSIGRSAELLQLAYRDLSTGKNYRGPGKEPSDLRQRQDLVGDLCEQGRLAMRGLGVPGRQRMRDPYRARRARCKGTVAVGSTCVRATGAMRTSRAGSAVYAGRRRPQPLDQALAGQSVAWALCGCRRAAAPHRGRQSMRATGSMVLELCGDAACGCKRSGSAIYARRCRRRGRQSMRTLTCEDADHAPRLAVHDLRADPRRMRRPAWLGRLRRGPRLPATRRCAVGFVAGR